MTKAVVNVGKAESIVNVFSKMTAAQRRAVETNDYSVVTGDQITAACQAALTEAAGKTCYFPAGVYRITSTLSYNPTPSTILGGFAGAGVRVTGDGMLRTFFDNRVANAPMIDIDSANHIPGNYQASMAARLEYFSIYNVTSPANSIGIRILNAYEVVIDHLYIKGMTAHGIELKNGLYLDDGWNMVTITNCWIDTCAGWGIKADGTATRNEGSYTFLRHVFFQTNGTADAAYQPPSGGMIWKGQVLVMESCAFANGTQNCGLFIKGESGLGQVVDLRNVTFENCIKRGLFVRGVAAFKGRNLQFFNNDSYVATEACEFEGGSFTIRNVDIDGVVVRATAGNNAYTAFKISGANVDFNTCRVQNVYWENFDFNGQTRWNGWQFDGIPTDHYLLYTPSASEVYLRPNQTLGKGNKVPLRLRGPRTQTPGTAVASTVGEWIAHRLTDAGLSLNITGFIANTRYWIYLYDNGGTPALEASSAASPTIDTTHSYAVKSGDATRYYVGSVVAGSTNGTVATSATGWANAIPVPSSQNGVFAFMWVDSTGDLRISNTAPTSDTGGTVVGTQT
jgi:hypothetical protein